MRAGASVIPASDLKSRTDDLLQRKNALNVSCVISRQDDGRWGLWAPGVGVDLVSFQPGCQVGQRMRPAMELPGPLLAITLERDCTVQHCPRLPCSEPWPGTLKTVPTDNPLRTISKVTESKTQKAPQSHFIALAHRIRQTWKAAQHLPFYALRSLW